MGLFKKKQKNDGVLSGGGLVEFFKSNLKNPTEENVLKAVQDFVKPDKDQEHLTPEGNMPWGWFNANREFTEQMVEEYKYFSNMFYESIKLSPKKKYEALKSLVVYLEAAKNLCYSKNECFAHWFDGVIASAEYISERKEDLEYLESNLETLQKEYEETQRLLDGLERKVLKQLKENDGILQSELLKKFDEKVRFNVSSILYSWEQEEKIERTKSGRSYILHLKEGQE